MNNEKSDCGTSELPLSARGILNSFKDDLTVKKSQMEAGSCSRCGQEGGEWHEAFCSFVGDAIDRLLADMEKLPAVPEAKLGHLSHDDGESASNTTLPYPGKCPTCGTFPTCGAPRILPPSTLAPYGGVFYHV